MSGEANLVFAQSGFHSYPQITQITKFQNVKGEAEQPDHNLVSSSYFVLLPPVFRICGRPLIGPSTTLAPPAEHRHRDPRVGTRWFAPARHSYKLSSATQLLQVHRKSFLPAASHRESIERNSDSVIRNRTQRLHCRGPASSPD